MTGRASAGRREELVCKSKICWKKVETSKARAEKMCRGLSNGGRTKLAPEYTLYYYYSA